MGQALIENVDFYYDDSGFMVLTEKYHCNRGYCCGHGCRHCPFDYDAVPEPQKSNLLITLKQTKLTNISPFDE